MSGEQRPKVLALEYERANVLLFAPESQFSDAAKSLGMTLKGSDRLAIRIQPAKADQPGAVLSWHQLCGIVVLGLELGHEASVDLRQRVMAGIQPEPLDS